MKTDDPWFWWIVYRGKHPIAAFALEGLANEFISREDYRKNDTVARKKISINDYPWKKTT